MQKTKLSKGTSKIMLWLKLQQTPEPGNREFIGLPSNGSSPFYFSPNAPVFTDFGYDFYVFLSLFEFNWKATNENFFFFFFFEGLYF